MEPRIRRAVARVAATGIVVTLATARPPRTVRMMAQAMDLTGLANCCNGALVCDLTRDTIVRHTPLAPEIARHLVSAMRAAVPGVCFGFEGGLTYACDPAWQAPRPAGRGNDAVRVDDALRRCDVPATKITARHCDHPIAYLLATARALAGASTIVTHSGAPYIEFSAPGVHKASALAAVCAHMGIGAAAVVAFGDMPNDVSMLAWAGYSAAAVLEALPL